MGLVERIELYRQLEQQRQRPLIVYVTSPRVGASASIASDSVHELELQLETIPHGTQAIDLLLVSNGGDPTVAWRIVTLVRERVKKFSVLVPAGAFSAATLIALGANSIVMHENGNLGPVDPQIRVRNRPKDGGAPEELAFGSEDLAAFIRFAKVNVGIHDQEGLTRMFDKFCEQVGTIPIGIAARSTQLSFSMAQKLLRMQGMTEKQAQEIAQKLIREFHHHGYALSRTEAKEIGLPVEDPEATVNSLIWKIWLNFVVELEIRSPFEPLKLVHANPDCAPLFAPLPSLNIPLGLPQQMLAQITAQLAAQAVVTVPPTSYKIVGTCLESARMSTHFANSGAIFASRQPDCQIKYSIINYRSGWEAVSLGTV